MNNIENSPFAEKWEEITDEWEAKMLEKGENEAKMFEKGENIENSLFTEEWEKRPFKKCEECDNCRKPISERRGKRPYILIDEYRLKFDDLDAQQKELVHNDEIHERYLSPKQLRLRWERLRGSSRRKKDV